MGVLGLEGEVQIEPGERVLELADCLATPVAPGDAQRMQEREFYRPVLGEQGGGVVAVRDGGEEFEQQGLGFFHCDGLSESDLRFASGSGVCSSRSKTPPMRLGFPGARV